jgi:hypothetical protein
MMIQVIPWPDLALVTLAVEAAQSHVFLRNVDTFKTQTTFKVVETTTQTTSEFVKIIIDKPNLNKLHFVHDYVESRSAQVGSIFQFDLRTNQSFNFNLGEST